MGQSDFHSFEVQVYSLWKLKNFSLIFVFWKSMSMSLNRNIYSFLFFSFLPLPLSIPFQFEYLCLSICVYLYFWDFLLLIFRRFFLPLLLIKTYCSWTPMSEKMDFLNKASMSLILSLSLCSMLYKFPLPYRIDIILCFG